MSAEGERLVVGVAREVHHGVGRVLEAVIYRPLTTASTRIYGTTKETPLVRFEEVERAALEAVRPALPLRGSLGTP